MPTTAKERALMRKLVAVVQRWRREPRRDSSGTIPFNMGMIAAADDLDEVLTAAYGSEWRAIQALSDTEGVKGEG